MKKITAIALLSFICLSCTREVHKQSTALNKIQIMCLDYKTKMIGKPAPDFEATALEGKKIKLSKLKDKVVVFYICYTGYERTNYELNSLNKVAEKYQNLPVEFLAIYYYDSEERVRKSLLIFPLKFQQIANAPQIAKIYKFPPQYPTLVTIDKNKVVTEIVYGDGAGTHEEVSISIDKALLAK